MVEKTEKSNCQKSLVNKMSISIHISFLLLLVIVMSFNNSTFGSRVSIQPYDRPPVEKVLSLFVENDLPENSEELHFIIVNEKPNYVLKQGAPLNFLTNFLPKQGQLTWIREQPLHATFNFYDPSAEGDHQKIFWSARQDGVYHSWDNVNWNKNTDWST